MRILIIGDITAPYRIEVFKGLSKKHETTTFFCSAKNESRNDAWFKQSSEEFKFEILDNEETWKHFHQCVANIINFDVVLCYAPWYKVARRVQRICWRKKVPCILNCDGALEITTSFPKKQLKSFYVKRADLCFAGCQRAVEYFETYGAKPENIVKHPFTSLMKDEILTAPYTREQKEAMKKELGMENKVTFVTVGQFIYRKGFDLLLKAWGKTSQEAQLYIIGGGPLEDEYNEIVSKSELENVHIIGFKKPAELQKYYRASDAFVLPTRKDIWGLVINEALSNGLPTISSNKCTAGNELVTNDFNGYVYECEDTDELASRIEALAQDAELRNLFATNALKAVEEYTIENIIESHLDSIEKITSK